MHSVTPYPAADSSADIDDNEKLNTPVEIISPKRIAIKTIEEHKAKESRQVCLYPC